MGRWAMASIAMLNWRRVNTMNRYIRVSWDIPLSRHKSLSTINKIHKHSIESSLTCCTVQSQRRWRVCQVAIPSALMRSTPMRHGTELLFPSSSQRIFLELSIQWWMEGAKGLRIAIDLSGANILSIISIQWWMERASNSERAFKGYSYCALEFPMSYGEP